MKTRFKLLSLGALTIMLYLIFWPVPVDPVKWDAPINAGYIGDFSPNTRLTALEHLDIRPVHGPEDVAAQLSDQGMRLWMSSQEGKIIELDPATQEIVTRADTGGVPLGIEFDSSGNLVIADAIKGLLLFTAAGELRTLTDQVGESAILFADDLDIAPDGRIYFSDASTRFVAKTVGQTLKASTFDLLEHGRSGRILVYDPSDGSTAIVKDGLSFANGVAMGPQGQSIIFNETGEYRIHRLWIAGEKAGQSEVILDNLPGYPDNINPGPDDTFFVGLVAPRSKFIDKFSNNPFMRKLALRLPEFMRPKAQNYGFIMQIDAYGDVIQTWQDPTGDYALTTGAILAEDGYLYVSSLHEDSLGRIKWRGELGDD